VDVTLPVGVTEMPDAGTVPIVGCVLDVKPSLKSSTLTVTPKIIEPI
jgi:hypothetical protein